MQNTNLNQVRQYLGLRVNADKVALLPSQEDLVDELKKGDVIEKTMLIPSQQDLSVEQIPAIQTPTQPQAPIVQEQKEPESKQQMPRQQMFEVPLQ
jgi:hypothetical protein